LHEALLSFGVGDFLCGQDFDGYLTTEAALDGTLYLKRPVNATKIWTILNALKVQPFQRFQPL
jgi:hypothetical protein